MKPDSGAAVLSDTPRAARERFREVVKELDASAKTLLAAHRSRRPFEGQLLADWQAASDKLTWLLPRSRELVRDYRPQAAGDYSKWVVLAESKMESIRNYMRDKSDYEDAFENFMLALQHIDGILEMIYIPEGPVATAAGSAPQPPGGNSVFLVHGHDERNQLELQRYLRDELHLNPIVMKYESGQGRTLIEKFEQLAQRATFAFVLLCPDDVVKTDEGHYTQARPNVLFELGWFYGRLTRSRVTILRKDGTELHSDLAGISRIDFTDKVEAKFAEVRKELVDAGVLLEG